jgi:hypothetical protein
MQLHPRFTLDNHALITQQANGGVLSDQQLGLVILANVLQDMHQTESWIHFDNCAFPDGLDYIAGEWNLIRESGDRYGDVALGAFGRLLHTVQDFYAHSNWIELHVNLTPIPVWDLKLGSLPTAIVSGTWSIGHPKRCVAGTPTHEQLNKDSANSQEGAKVVTTGPNKGQTLFRLAFAAAVGATKIQFAQLQSVILVSGILKAASRPVREGATAAELVDQLLESMHNLKH